MRFAMVLLAMLATIAAASSNAAPPSRTAIQNEAQFTELARTIAVGRHASFPQVMFVIDRNPLAGKPALYFVNTRTYAFHIDFIHRSYLSTQTIEQLNRNYTEPNRRFLLGSVVGYPALGRYGVEFWEGDLLDRALIETAMRALQAAFPKPLAFKPNSQAQQAVAADIPGLATIDANAVYGSRSSLVLNAGSATGRLRILDRVTPQTLLARSDIVILNEAPLQMSPVAGIVTTEFSTPLAHVNLLAKSWRVPNGFLREADKAFVAFDGKMVRLTARGNAIAIRLATAAEIKAAAKVRQAQAIRIAKADLAFRGFPALAEQRRGDSIRTGAKAANLGEVARRAALIKAPDFEVPPGFSVPFAYYADFVRANGLDRKITALLAHPSLNGDPLWRKAALKDLREAFAAAPFDPALLAQLTQRRAAVIGAGGVFARSSTNSEDLQGFNGAGLYSSVPNVLTGEDLAKAIKTVWGSVWNETAFDARAAAGIDHRSVMASVLIQQGMNADAAGVAITENPFDPLEAGAIFINAKRGLGIRVVEGRRVAEQLIYRSDPEGIQVLTRSTDDAMLTFDANGGVKELPVEPGRAVLTDAMTRRLARVSATIAEWFGGVPQDIEWLAIGDTLYIVQSRPYLRGS